MDRPISKLLEKLKLTDSGSVKLNSPKKKHDPAGNINNSNGNSGGLATQVPQQSSVQPEEQAAAHASALAPLRRRSPQQRASCYLGEGLDSHLRREAGPECDSAGHDESLNRRRYSLELQQLVRRQQLLSQPPPYPVNVSYGSGPRGAAETGYLSEPERHKRLSLQEALFYKRLSTGSEMWESPRPASLSHPPQRPADAFFYPPGPALSPCSSFSLQESVLVSPRSSFASSTASGGGGGGSPMGSRCSSNRTSGISLGYDSRYSNPPQRQSPSSQTGPVYGRTPVEAWTQYLDTRQCAYDTRHSYPPAVGSPAAACYPAGPEWWDEQRSRGKEGGIALGEKSRHSDLPGMRYQEELTRLLLRDAALEGGGLLEGLMLKEQSATPTALSKPGAAPVPSPAGVPQIKAQEDLGAAAGREATENRQEFFGTCIKCGKGVYGADNACQALDSLYHTRCFTCVSCGRALRNKDFYNVNGSVYCKEDYMFSGFQAAAEKCSVCGHLILEQILQALGNSYHPGCFRCVVCSKALDGVPFTVDQHSNIYCVADYNKTFAPKCAACLQPILPTEGSEEILRVVSMNKDYHFECYHCEECGKQLSDKPGSQCFPLDSHLLCHPCHVSRVCGGGN
ncbi:Wilms tumor protein 1-interacting protein [Corythoichthys intestinalis]|uniref:Wilms tumor protein 1-interacting protein n=1 Tax=Corythoichthys intestinalis TaxID=161448 RepID=UPI0025A4EB78|nr:Wilms tumor protein 1-interacting protein [Corythoichthys intestinalis]XP_061810807.1 Wilms tumor protein 1-interacting protein-like [Nerophis lumbriciformis]